MNLLLYFLVFISFSFFLLRNRLDFSFIFFCSTCLYHWQIIGGTVIIPPFYFAATDISKIIVFTVLLIHTLVTFIFDKIYKEKLTYDNFNVSKKYDLFAFILCFLSLFNTIYALYIVGIDFTFKHEYKQALAANNISMVWIHYPAAISILYGTLTKNRMLFLLSLLPLIFYAYAGYRAVIIIAYIGVITIYCYNSKLSGFKSLKIGILSIIIFLFFAFYKVSYYDIKNKEVSAVKQFKERSIYYDKNEYLKKVLFYNEFGQISANLVLSVERNLGQYYQVSSVILGSIPFVKKFTSITEDDVRFNRLIEEYANLGFSYGLGGTIWGEGYAAFNFFGVILFSLIFSLTISFLNKNFYRTNLLFIFSPLFLSYLSFYIHRSELTLVFAHLKNIIYLILIAFIISTSYKFFTLLININKKNH